MLYTECIGYMLYKVCTPWIAMYWKRLIHWNHHIFTTDSMKLQRTSCLDGQHWRMQKGSCGATIIPGKSMTFWSNGTWTIHGMTPQTMYCTVHLGSSFHMPMMNIIAADTTFVCISLPSKLGLSKEFVGYIIYKDDTPWNMIYGKEIKRSCNELYRFSEAQVQGMQLNGQEG